MFMLTIEGWINGTTHFINFIFCIIFGLYFMFKSIKPRVKLLFIFGLMLIFIGVVHIGVTIDFIILVLTGSNLEYIPIFHSLVWMYVPFFFFCALYIGTEIMMPKKKWFILVLCIFLGFLFNLFLFLDPFTNLEIIEDPGNDVLTAVVKFGSPASIVSYPLVIFYFIFLVVGFLIKSVKSIDLLRRKFFYLSLGSLITAFYMFLIGQFNLGEATLYLRVVLRICFLIGFYTWYLGLREEPEKSIEKPKKKEIVIEKELFRLIKRPDRITEEEVTISKEKKICLVCKGKVGGFNFLCNECGAFYCEKCAKSLMDLENTCWICNIPMDSSKPSKTFEEQEEKLDIKASKEEFIDPKEK